MSCTKLVVNCGLGLKNRKQIQHYGETKKQKENEATVDGHREMATEALGATAQFDASIGNETSLTSIRATPGSATTHSMV